MEQISPRTVLTETGNRLVMRSANLEDVTHFQAEEKYVLAHSSNGAVILEATLKGLEKEFAETFIRIHRSTLVARKRCLNVVATPDGKTVINVEGLDAPLTLSRRCRSSFYNQHPEFKSGGYRPVPPGWCETMGRQKIICGCPDCGSSIVQVAL